MSTPKGVKPITYKLVFCVKYDASREVEHYKVWIVAQGFTQVEGVDYKEVWAPVANLKLIHVILALVTKYNLELDQIDVVMAYLNRELKEELYMLLPEGVAIPNGYCWWLKRLLYGLKQVGWM